MFSTTPRATAKGIFWTKLGKRRGSTSERIARSWIPKFPKKRIGTNGKPMRWMHEKCWSCFWMMKGCKKDVEKSFSNWKKGIKKWLILRKIWNDSSPKERKLRRGCGKRRMEFTSDLLAFTVGNTVIRNQIHIWWENCPPHFWKRTFKIFFPVILPHPYGKTAVSSANSGARSHIMY